MDRIVTRLLLTPILLFVGLDTLSCGGGINPNRMLESISVSPQAGHGQVQFVATGTFSAPPVKVTPLTVNWSLPPQPLCAGCGADLTPQGLATCPILPPNVNVTVTASAPADPKIPLNSQGVPKVSGTATRVCP